MFGSLFILAFSQWLKSEKRNTFFENVECDKFFDSPRDHTMVNKCVLTLCFVASYVLTKLLGDLVTANAVSLSHINNMIFHFFLFA